MRKLVAVTFVALTSSVSCSSGGDTGTSVPNGGDGGGVTNGSSGNTPPAASGDPFPFDWSKVQSYVVSYYCTLQGVGEYYWTFDGKGGITVFTSDVVATGVTGTYKVEGESLQVDFANPPLKESVTSIVKRLGTIGSFNVSSGVCHLQAQNIGGTLAAARYQCPPIRAVGSTYNDNLFELNLSGFPGALFWNSRDEYTSGSGNTVHHRRYGAYRSDGKKIYMYLGASDAQKDLIADIISPQEISVLGLEPEKGTCKLTQ